MSTPTLPMLEAVDAAIAQVRKSHPGIPDVTVVLGAAGKSRSGQVHGHFAPDSWKSAGDGKQKSHEIMLSGESLERGAEATLGTIIHELAHAYAHAHDIKDTSNHGRYHNKKFKEIGNKFGIELEQAGTIGWSVTKLADGTAEKYAKALEQLAKALTSYRVPNGEKITKPAKKRQMQCPECLDPVTVTKKWFEKNEFNLICSEHDEQFEMIETEA